jgi:hypothetical protein
MWIKTARFNALYSLVDSESDSDYGSGSQTVALKVDLIFA